MSALRLRARALLPGLAFIAFWIAALEVAARAGWVNKLFSPFPSQIATQLGRVVGAPAFLDALASTVGLLAVGYSGRFPSPRCCRR